MANLFTELHCTSLQPEPRDAIHLPQRFLDARRRASTSAGVSSALRISCVVLPFDGVQKRKPELLAIRGVQRAAAARARRASGYRDRRPSARGVDASDMVRREPPQIRMRAQRAPAARPSVAARTDRRPSRRAARRASRTAACPMRARPPTASPRRPNRSRSTKPLRSLREFSSSIVIRTLQPSRIRHLPSTRTSRTLSAPASVNSAASA